MLLAKGHKVRALVRREDERALHHLGAEVVQGDLTDLASTICPALLMPNARVPVEPGGSMVMKV
jgi:hypothetical protein